MRARRLVSLIWSQINSTFALSHSYYYYIRKGQRLWELPLIAVSILSLAGIMGTGAYWLASEFYRSAAAAGQGGLTVVAGLLATQFLIMVLGFVVVIGVFYYSHDLTILIPLPLRPWEVVAGKFSVVMVSEYLVQLVFTLPLLAAYAVHSSVNGIWFWLHVIPIFLLLPAIPLVFGAVPAILFMRLARSARRRDLLVVVGGFVLVMGIIGLQFLFTSALPDRSEAQTVGLMLRQADGLVDVMGAVFPPSLWAARALIQAGTGTGFLNLLLFASASLLAVLILLTIGERVFYRGVIEGFEVARARKREASPDRALARLRRRPPALSVAWTEVRLFSRTPVFVLNGFLGFVLLPTLFLLMRSTGDQELKDLLEAVEGSPAATGLLLGAYLLALVAMSTIPFSPFSREGIRNIWILRSLPISGRTAALGKLFAALGMVWMGSIPGLALLMWMLSVPLPYAVGGILAGMAASAAFSIWGILVDMVHPMLFWTSQTRAIKSNTNTLISLVLGVLFLLGSGFLVKRAFDAGFAGHLVVLGTVALMLAILGASWLLLTRLADRLWLRLEV